MTAVSLPESSALAEAPDLPSASGPANVHSGPIVIAPGSSRSEASFNLAALVREVVSNGTSSDPGVLADEVLDAIDPRDYGAALRACLRTIVRRAFSDQRRQALGPQTDEGGQAEPVESVPSAKVRAIRSVRALLETRVNVGEGQHKHLGDCTVADLSAAAQLMRAQAAAQARRANQYDNIAVLLNRHHGRRVSDLPGELLLEAVRT